MVSNHTSCRKFCPIFVNRGSVGVNMKVEYDLLKLFQCLCSIKEALGNIFWMDKGTFPANAGKTGIIPMFLIREIILCNKSNLRCKNVFRIGPPHFCIFPILHQARKAGPVIYSEMSACDNPIFVYTRLQISSWPVKAKGMLIPCKAIQSISFSHRSQSHQTKE